MLAEINNIFKGVDKIKHPMPNGELAHIFDFSCKFLHSQSVGQPKCFRKVLRKFSSIL